MEESKLNFNVPFLSVRRLSSTSSTTGHIIPFDTDTVTGADDVCSRALDTFFAYPQQMSHFSPAAAPKVMTLKTPPYTSREQCMSLEQSREVREVAVILPYYEDSYNLSTTLCGLLPRLCFMSSMCLFNHVPGLKVRTREVAKPESKSDSADQSHMLPEIGKNMQSWGSNRLTSSNDMQMVHWCPPERSPVSSRIPPYRRERPRSLFSGRGFLGIPKEAEKSKANVLVEYTGSNNYCQGQELVAYLSTKQGSDSQSAAMEKTLHIEPASVESSLQAIKCLNLLDRKGISENEMTGSGNSCSSSFYDKLDLREKSDQGEAKGGSDYAHLPPPPLPKTPSESWLSRALPAVASRNSFSKS